MISAGDRVMVKPSRVQELNSLLDLGQGPFEVVEVVTMRNAFWSSSNRAMVYIKTQFPEPIGFGDQFFEKIS